MEKYKIFIKKKNFPSSNNQKQEQYFYSQLKKKNGKRETATLSNGPLITSVLGQFSYFNNEIEHYGPLNSKPRD